MSYVVGFFSVFVLMILMELMGHHCLKEWLKMRYNCLLCWYWWSWWPSLFKLSFQNVQYEPIYVANIADSSMNYK